MDYKHGGNIYELDISKEKIIDFSANINPLGVSKKLENIIRESIENITNYPDPNYMELRNVISKEYDVDIENIVVGNGGIQLIHNVIEFLNFENALIVTPTFVEYEKAVKRFNKKVNYYKLNEKNDFKLDINSLLKKNLSNEELIIICNPNNPTGKYIDKKDLIKLLDYFKENNKFLLLDESFMDFLEDKLSLLDVVKEYENLIIIRSLTKFFSIPGLRLGFLVSNNKKIINNINKFRESWSVNEFANNFGKVIFKDKKYIRDTKKYIKEQRHFLTKELEKFKFLKIYKSSANYIFFKSHINLDLKKELIKYNILIRKCNNYIGLDDNFYRIAVKNKKNNDYLIQCIKEIKEKKID